MEFSETYLIDPEEYYSREVEPLGEMATVGASEKPSLSVQINPDDNRVGNPYFKVYNDELPKKGKTKVCRLHFFDAGMEYHRDKYLDWIPNSKDIKNILRFLMEPHEREKVYTNWQMTKWLWNLEYKFFTPRDIDRYMNGELDLKFKDHPSYVPSDTTIPETWVYDPPKGKNKRK
jgi:hypothetical protein